ncbi:histidine kinase [Arthrobacter sp. Soil782]|uniref:response regulator transcription factor n=1 Tax=Arthrobacter sp. Soil782 TaxID=1736410 RepID=UPI0006FA411F|nr:response regulator [Arthrobacter sp. Soil782]KRF09160.1 histidine kinase [Arthrobacter sp. Soil782]
MPHRILVVDDDADIRDLVSTKLESSGYEVETAGDGVAGLELAINNEYSLVISDVMMPGMSGVDMVRMMRSAEPPISVPVILLTAKNQERDIESGFAAGVTDYVVKPFSPRELAARVAGILAR